MDQLKAFFEEKYPDVEMTYLRAAGAELATIFQPGNGPRNFHCRLHLLGLRLHGGLYRERVY